VVVVVVVVGRKTRLGRGCGGDSLQAARPRIVVVVVVVDINNNRRTD
jgi:ribosomal protein L7Ae-like RNA K-turn-binding protein